jgi:hypothetical protein
MWGTEPRVSSERAGRLALASLIFCFAAAFLPTVAFCLVLRWTHGVPEDVGGAVYLSTPALIFVFAASYFGRRGPGRSDRSGPKLPSDATETRPTRPASALLGRWDRFDTKRSQ